MHAYSIYCTELINDKSALASNTPLQLACSLHNKPLIEILLERGANVHCRSASGWSALDRACLFGQSDIVTALLTSGARVNCLSRNSWTRLHDACVGHEPEQRRPSPAM